MSAESPKELVLARFEHERETWRSLVDAVGPDRMDEPGPMGEWTFRDLAAHLLAWRERFVSRLEEAAGGPPASDPWPESVADDDDSINEWIQEQADGRQASDILREIEGSYERLRAAVARLDDDVLVTPGRLPWLDGDALVDWPSHLLEEHEPAVREWLATRDR